MDSLENQHITLQKNEENNLINEFELVDLETNINQLKEEIEFNLRNLSALKNSLYKIIEFEDKKLKSLVKKWGLNYEQCQKEK